jgi:hypothetical protein
LGLTRLIQRCAPEPDTCIARVSLRLGIPLGALATALVMVTGHFSEIEIPYVMSLLAGDGLSGGSQGIREELAKQEDRFREAISTWPLAPRSGSLSGYREICDRELADGHRGLLPALGHGVFTTVLVTSSVYLACLSVRAAVAGLIRRGPDAALIDFSSWRRLFGPGGVATAQQTV